MAATRLAAPLLAVLVAPKSRIAQEALELRAQRGQGVFLVTTAGNDGLAHLARAHLSGARAAEAFVVVDCVSEQSLSEWQDGERSPLRAADRGTLVLQDMRAMPLGVQRFIARVHAERRMPEGDAAPLDFVLVLTSREAPSRLLEEQQLAPELLERLTLAPPITLPTMQDRAEDLRALVLAKLAREGMRAYGRPLGIHDAAFALLVEYPFVGGEAELDAMVIALARMAGAAVIEAQDVRAVLSLARATREADAHETHGDDLDVERHDAAERYVSRSAVPVSRASTSKSVATKRRSSRHRR